jgi:hypothetical protein
MLWLFLREKETKEIGRNNVKIRERKRKTMHI